MKTKTLRSPLRGWLGGKFQLANRIIPLIPEHTCYVEPFAGAAWVLFKKQPSKSEVINDINQDVINLYRMIKHHPDALCNELALALPSRNEFERLMLTPAETLTEIQRAARFLYIHRCSFGGKIYKNHFGTAKTSPPKFNPVSLQDELRLVHQRISRCFIECQDYTQVIQRYDGKDTFFYIDPPYWGCENDYGEKIFSPEDFKSLAELLIDAKGKFLMSINDTPEIREIYNDFNLTPVSLSYSVSKSKPTIANELFITNF
ncbi:MAG: adenine methyltransferase [Gammaproteobacteria bacterium]|nr:MAG: adenine methyltransferase [Gammaproteobacteria bacterium]